MAVNIVERPIADIIHESFIDYAKEVIEDRALPDVRDGLKPVQRRILYTMYRSGFTPDKPFRKSAATVGEVLKNLHPHGDASIYNALVKMAQSFNKRYPLVEGHGNFGTIDDNPAAMRYTESRLSPAAMLMLEDIDRNVVEWKDNYDDTMKEPEVLPSMLPNLIINGGSGIAVGVASNIPPHNLEETIDAICAYIKKPAITTKELMKFIKGPDFPTGGIVSPKGLLECYETGTGTAVIRGRVVVEELPDDKRQLVITEIPYQVSKESLISRIANLVENENIEDVIEIRDESDKDGIRIIIEVDSKADVEKILGRIYAKTPLQSNFNYNVVALVDNKPKVLPLREAIKEFVNHRKEIVIRRTRYELNKARKRQHILEGLIVAVDNIDEIIRIIRNSKSVAMARKELLKATRLSEVQVQAILNLKLQRLVHLEVEALKKELKKLVKVIERLESILKSEENVLKEIIKELQKIKRDNPNERKTEIIEFDKISIKTKVDRFTLQINDNKSVRKLSPDYRGNRGATLKTDSTKTIVSFDEEGYIRKFTSRTLPSRVKCKVLALCNEDEVADDADIIFVTTDGQIKKSAFSEYREIKEDSAALKLNEKAKVASVLIGRDESEIIIITEKGFVIRFDHLDVRQIGRIGIGVRAIRLEDGDKVVGAITVNPNDSKKLQVETRSGEKKSLEIRKITSQGRGGKGTNFFAPDSVIKVIGAK
ncbi:MAG: DNA topoisomerase 4 subunit A [Thermoanaerobacteraceae bacterium]|nr:DNA topoisomerase 4 subunit A [Thermoanaerobacteraceae bacterium]